MADFTHTKINGYDVYLINTHAGNGVALTANVQVGSWHDDPVRHAGRAHLWEHWIHGGSAKYPGHQTFFARMNHVGGSYNAYTAHERTFYHWFGHPDGLEEAADNIGAMLSAPEFNPETFRMERSTVKNEAQEYQNQDGEALVTSLWLYNLPDGHPLKMYNVGTQAQLDAMDPEDLKALFLANYVPGSMQIVAAANFDPIEGTPPMTAARLGAAIAAHFKAPAVEPGFKVPAPGRTKAFPSIRDDKGGPLKLVELGTGSPTFLLKLCFEIDGTVAPGVRETLTDYLNLPVKGGLSDRLQKKGWITALSVYTEQVNALRLVSVYFQLTPEGTKRRADVVSAFLSVVRELREKGPSESILEYLRQRNILSYRHSTRKADQAAEHLARFFDSGLPPEQAFDFAAIYGTVTANDVRAAVPKLFQLERMLAAYLGGDVKSDTVDPLFGRAFRRLEAPEVLAAWKKALAHGVDEWSLTLQLPAVPFSTTETPAPGRDQAPRELPGGAHGARVALDESHRLPTGGFLVELRAEPSTAERAQSALLYARAFRLRHKGELDYLASMNVPTFAQAGQSTLRFGVSGNSGAVPTVLPWILKSFATFEPTMAELETAREETRAAHRQHQDQFTAMIALDSVSSFLHGSLAFHDDELLATLDTLDLANVVRETRALFHYTFVTAAVSGDFSEEQASAMVAEVCRTFPGRLPAARRDEILRPFPAQRAPLAMRQPLGATKNAEQFGWARAFPGPVIGSREHAALAVLVHSMGEAVFQLNRIKKELGYVHNMTLLLARSGARPVLYGQTEGRARLGEIEAGWRELLSRVGAGTLAPDDFAGARRAMLRNKLLLPYDDSEIVARLFRDFELAKDPGSTAQWKEHLRSVTPEEIYGAGRRYLVGSPPLDVVASKEPLADMLLLERPAELRRALEVK